MKKLCTVLLFLFVSLAFAATGERYKTNEGILGQKEFTADNWRDNWTVIFSGQFDNDGIEDIFFYDPTTGEAESYSTTPNGIKLINKYTGFRKTWKNILMFDYDGDSRDEILFYDPANGVAEIYRFEGPSLKLVTSQTDWRKSWKTIVSVNVDGDLAREILLYDYATGEAELLDFAKDGKRKSLKVFKNWRKNWHQVKEVNLNHDQYSDILFYDQDKGVGEFYSFTSDGGFKNIKTHNNWRKNWRTIVPGNYGSGRNNGDLLFYDPTNGDAEYYALKPDGTMSNYKNPNPKYRTGWDIILSGRFGHTANSGLLFYDSSKYIENYQKIYGKKPY
ncbi:MAG: hypothetical protein JXR48_18030 [Candidatus Delongbacteria bacterium]|nr:hypothetical protein [Candidatus Delongbacteria bacterium]MBN2836859.1 hypothetical protein [Candidatus Delongbacteria bacterium]